MQSATLRSQSQEAVLARLQKKSEEEGQQLDRHGLHKIRRENRRKMGREGEAKMEGGRACLGLDMGGGKGGGGKSDRMKGFKWREREKWPCGAGVTEINLSREMGGKGRMRWRQHPLRRLEPVSVSDTH